MGYERHPSAPATNALVSPQYVSYPGASANAIVSPQYQAHPEGVTPLTILGGAAGGVLQWCRSDLGITLNGSTVSAWADQSGNAHDYSQGTAANQPTYNSTGGPNSTPALEFDGSNDSLVNTSLNRVAPATTNTWLWMIAKFRTWTASDTICASNDATTRMIVYQTVATPNILSFNGVNSSSITTIANNTWFRAECLFSGSTSDYLKVITASVTGVNTGNNAANGRVVGSRNSAANPADCVFTEIVIFSGNPSADQKSQLDQYATSRYGVGLT